MSRKYEDLSGNRFGKLVVLNRVAEITKRVTWLCQCDCGNTTTVGSSALKRGVTKSCGCLVPNSMRARENREIKSRALNSIIPDIPVKICTRCKVELPLTQFQFYGRKYPQYRSMCNECWSDYCRDYRSKPSTKTRQKLLDDTRNLDYNRKRSRVTSKKNREIVLNHYGNGDPKCVCCGETCYEFLCIDHINGGGTAHKQELRKLGTTLYSWLIKNNFPDGYQILCHNCNQSLGFYGYCPHGTLPEREVLRTKWSRPETTYTLPLHVKKQYFDEIESGIKTEEYREIKHYWKVRIEGKTFDHIKIVCGYTKKQICFPWNGYVVKNIVHPQFGNVPTPVYAIKLVR